MPHALRFFPLSSALMSRVRPRFATVVVVSIASILSLVAGAAAAQSFERPRGIYYLGSNGPIPDDEVLSLPYVDGYVLRGEWSEFEHDAGDYDFQRIEDALLSVEFHGKKLTIAIITKIVPQHILQMDGVETYFAFSDSGDVLTALPWDSTTLRQWSRFVRVLSTTQFPTISGERVSLRSHPGFGQIAAQIPGLGVFRDQQERMVSHPSYERGKFLQSLQRAIHPMVRAFPDHKVHLGFFGMSDGEFNPTVDEEALDLLRARYFDGVTAPDLGLYTENLGCSSPPGLEGSALFDSQQATWINFQMLQSWVTQGLSNTQLRECLVREGNQVVSGPGTAISHGIEEFSALYFEVYHADLSEPGLAAELSQAHSRIWAQTKPDQDPEESGSVGVD